MSTEKAEGEILLADISMYSKTQLLRLIASMKQERAALIDALREQVRHGTQYVLFVKGGSSQRIRKVRGLCVSCGAPLPGNNWPCRTCEPAWWNHYFPNRKKEYKNGTQSIRADGSNLPDPRIIPISGSNPSLRSIQRDPTRARGPLHSECGEDGPLVSAVRGA